MLHPPQAFETQTQRADAQGERRSPEACPAPGEPILVRDVIGPVAGINSNGVFGHPKRPGRGDQLHDGVLFLRGLQAEYTAKAAPHQGNLMKIADYR